MDEKTRDALRSEEYSQLYFNSSSAAKLVQTADGFTGYIAGRLVIAGQARDVELKFDGRVLDGNKLWIKGSRGLLMTEYEIEPPKAMMGALKTGNEVIVEYEILWKPADMISAL